MTGTDNRCSVQDYKKGWHNVQYIMPRQVIGRRAVMSCIRPADTGLQLLRNNQRERERAGADLWRGGFNYKPLCIEKIINALLFLMGGYAFVDFHPQTVMAARSLARVVLMFVGFFTFLMAITFNSLSTFGAKSGEHLSDKSKHLEVLQHK